MILTPDILDCAEIDLLTPSSSFPLPRALNDLFYSSFEPSRSTLVA